MSGKESKTEFDFSGFTQLLDDRTSNIAMMAALVLSLVVLSYTTIDLANLNEEVRGLVEGDNSWDVSFELQSFTFQETVVMVDGEQRQLDFDVDPSDVPEGFRVGNIRATVSYGETSGLPADPADSVAANVPQTSMQAQWSDDNNTLSGSSNDASDIELLLRTPWLHGPVCQRQWPQRVSGAPAMAGDRVRHGHLFGRVGVEHAISPVPQ